MIGWLDDLLTSCVVWRRREGQAAWIPHFVLGLPCRQSPLTPNLSSADIKGKMWLNGTKSLHSAVPLLLRLLTYFVLVSETCISHPLRVVNRPIDVEITIKGWLWIDYTMWACLRELQCRDTDVIHDVRRDAISRPIHALRWCFIPHSVYLMQ